MRRWKYVAAAALILAILGGAAGLLVVHTTYKATAQLMRQESTAPYRASELGEPFKPRQLSVPTLVGFMKSPAVLLRVAEQTQLPARAIANQLTITPERNTDLITLTFASSRSAQTAVRVLNAFGSEIVRLTREMQSQEAAELNRLLKKQLARTEEDVRSVNQELLEFSQKTGLISVDKEIDAYLRTLGDLDMKFETTRIELETIDLKTAALERELTLHNPLMERVQLAREKLNEMLQHYTEANPLVQEQKTAVSELEERVKSAGSHPLSPPRQSEGGLAAAFYAELLNLRTQKQVSTIQLEKLKAVRTEVEQKLRGLPEKGMQYARIRARQQSLETAQSLLASRQREAQLYEDNALGYYCFFNTAVEEVEVAGRSSKILTLILLGWLSGAFLSIVTLCLIESFDDRIKTSADLKRVTRLPLLASLPSRETLDPTAATTWAFRTWLQFRSKFRTGPRGETICGFVSESPGEGKSTWIELLGDAASQRNESVVIITNREPIHPSALSLDLVLDAPSRLTPVRGQIQWLVTADDYRWNASRRTQWARALETWSQSQGLVVLVELTDPDHPDTLLIAESLPQLIWLSSSGLTLGHDCRERLQTYQLAGCHLLGAVLNREPKFLPMP